MQYSPKLKSAAGEIKAILRKYDIAGIVVLHTPGFGEYLYEISPNYSCAKLVENGIRIKTNPADTKERKMQLASDTANMFTILSDVSARLTVQTIDTFKLLEKELNIERLDGGGHTSHTQQNN